jgi:hypothetical protein
VLKPWPRSGVQPSDRRPAGSSRCRGSGVPSFRALGLILDPGGNAIGIVNISPGFKTDDGREMGRPREGGPNALLIACLPGWLLLELRGREGLNRPLSCLERYRKAIAAISNR